ncbi:MAG: TonB-dependent receptor [SAR324 cluster bacterium]|nr:TonB-dependent receptor [SAR324 cluster bacterium]
MKSLICYTLMACMLLTMSPDLMAEDMTNANEPVKLEEVVSVATRREVSVERVGGSSVSVITQEELENRQQPQVKDVLKGTPGLDISSSGGMGGSSFVQVRGADSKNTLLLMDGVMLNDPAGANRGADIGGITLDNIERIEIIRGPQSVLYGSNATAGVINLVTAKGKGTPKSYVGAEYGSYRTSKFYQGSEGSVGAFNFSFNTTLYQSEGFSVADSRNTKLPDDGNTDEADGWQNTTISTRLGYELSETFEINLFLRNAQSSNKYDDYGSGFAGDEFSFDPNTFASIANPDGEHEQEQHETRTTGKLELHGFAMDKTLEWRVYHNLMTSDRTNFDANGDESYDYLGSSNETGTQVDWFAGDVQIISLGGSQYTEMMNSDANLISDKSAATSSFWTQYELDDDALNLVLGARNDNHETFGSATTYRLAPAYRIESIDTKIKASYGTGFRAPSLYELYSAYGNKKLEAELSTGMDAGFEVKFAKSWKVGLTWFSNVFTNRIDYDFTTSAYAQMEGDTLTSGTESFVEGVLSPSMELGMNLTQMTTEDPNGEPLPRRPELKALINFLYKPLETLKINTDLHHVGERDTVPSLWIKMAILWKRWMRMR